MTRIRLFLFIIAILAPSLAAAQQSMKFEEAAAMLAASCGKDIDDNCRGVNLDATRLKECLGRNQDVVSAKCKADFPTALGAIQQRITARTSLVKLCNWELKHLCGEVRAAHEKRTKQITADVIGRRPVRRIVEREPPFPRGEQARREVASVPRDHFDADRFGFQMLVLDQAVREGHCLIYRPLVLMFRVDRPRQRAHRRGADVVKTKLAAPAEVSASVEIAGRTAEPLEFAPRIRGGLGNYPSFLRIKHFK